MRRVHLVQLVLFLVTFFTLTLAGAELRYAKSFYEGTLSISRDFTGGLIYSLTFILFLITHEMGHYLMALKNKVKVTLPFFIPMWLGFLPPLPSIGTMGAFIMIRSKAQSRRAYFDIGVAGPLAGFVVTLIIFIAGFLTLPPLQYIFDIHPEYLSLGQNYGDYMPAEGVIITIFKFGSSLLSTFLEWVIPYDQANYPHPNEMLHYPLLSVGYITMFFTAINLLPIGQLDGGHIIYGLFGKEKHSMISRVVFIGFLFYSGVGLISPGRFDFMFFVQALGYVYFLYVCLFHVNTERSGRLMLALIIFVGQFILQYIVPGVEGYPGLLLMGFVIGRFIGIDHPETEDERPLDTKRKIVGWLAIFVFIISISPKPFVFEVKSRESVGETTTEEDVNIIQEVQGETDEI